MPLFYRHVTQKIVFDIGWAPMF